MRKALLSLLSFFLGYKPKHKSTMSLPDFSKEVPDDERIH